MGVLKKIKPTSWYMPVILLVGFFLVFGFLIGMIQYRIQRSAVKEIASDIDAVAESVRLRLKGNEDYLLMLGKDRAANLLNQQQFQHRASHYVEAHPEMINITWVDSTFHVQDVAPLEGNSQIIGLEIYLSEPQRVSNLAKKLRKPQYTNVFEAIQGNPSFEIWIPIYRGDTFLGFLAGVYSCERVVNILVPDKMSDRYDVSLMDENGLIYSQHGKQDSGVTDIKANILINEQNSMAMQFIRKGWRLIDWTLLSMIILCLVLVAGMAWFMWTSSIEVTRRMETEQALQKQNVEYALLNEEYKVQNTELQVAKEKAEMADRLKSAFLANVSHEIRTPLNSIVGFSSLLGEPNLKDEEKQSYINLVESNSESLLVLIDEILDLSKIESKQLTLKKQEFSMDFLLSELYLIFHQGNKNSKVELKISQHIKGKSLFVFSDRIRVKQVLINFLSNAFKFTDEGFIEMGYFLSQDQEIVIYVKDTGIGIKREYHQEIFQRFRKLNENSSRIYRGTGLGLAISDKIIELLGGRVWIESEPGKGSTFFFTLQDCQLKDVSA